MVKFFLWKTTSEMREYCDGSPSQQLARDEQEDADNAVLYAVKNGGKVLTQDEVEDLGRVNRKISRLRTLTTAIRSLGELSLEEETLYKDIHDLLVPIAFKE